MRPFIATEVPASVLSLLDRTRGVIATIPDDLVGRDGKPIQISCHHVAHVVEAILPNLRCVDGFFAKGYEHSWLATRDPDYIIDPYPIGALPAPMLLCMTRFSPWAALYDASRQPAAVQTPEFPREVAAILLARQPARSSSFYDVL